MVVDVKRKAQNQGPNPAKKFQKMSPNDKKQGFQKKPNFNKNQNGNANSPKGISANMSREAPKKPPMKVEVVEGKPQKNGAAPAAPQAAQNKDKKNDALKKIDPKSKAIKKQKGKPNQTPQKQQKNQEVKHQKGKGKKKNRNQRLQHKLDQHVRTKALCEKALALEKEMMGSGRVFTVKLPDPIINDSVISGWSSKIESTIFNKPVEPRQFLIVFKPGTDVKKEIESLKKVTFNGGKLSVEEKSEGDPHANTAVDMIDPYTLYVTNLDETINKDALREHFPKASNIMNPRKHSPKLKTPTKFAFIAFDNAEDAYQAFKSKYFTVINGKTFVMRFRRVSQQEKKQGLQEEGAAPATPAKKETQTPAKAKEAATPAKKEQQTPAKQQQQTPQVKKEAATPVSAKKAAVTPNKPAVKAETLGKKLPVAKKVEEDEDEDDEDDDEDEDENGLGALEIDDGDDDDDDDEEDDDEDDEELEGEEDDDDDDDDEDDDDEEDDDEDDDDDDDDDDDE